VKVCSESRDELEDWAKETVGGDVTSAGPASARPGAGHGGTGRSASSGARVRGIGEQLS